MSLVTMILIKNKKLAVTQKHWREVEELLKYWPKLETKTGLLLDEGYIIIDLDSRTIVNNQLAFSVKPPKFWELIGI